MLSLAAALIVASLAGAAPQGAAPPVRVFLDCNGCYRDYVREEVKFVDYVRDRTQADVHVLVTSTETGGGGREYIAELIGAGPFQGVNQTLKTVTTRSDPEDVVRRQIANTLRIGLLGYVARRGVPQNLVVQVEDKREAGARPAAGRDRWNNWVFSLRGSASFEGEESSRQTDLSGSIGADRITPAWKITVGADFEHETERFDLDEDEPVRVERRQRELNWLAVKALGEHWSVGAGGDVESSTFENIELSMRVSPAIEFNVFPYAAYNRRQLRVLYSLGVTRNAYYEETLLGKTDETLPSQSLSVTYDQRERWGSIGGRVEASQYLNDLSKSRLEVDTGISVRIVRGLSVSGEANASRIRDQVSLPARGATPQEVLLRLRQLQSGYDYDVSLSLTYSFGSIFSSIVNPRFGR